MSMSEYMTPDQEAAATANLDQWAARQRDEAIREFNAAHDPTLAGGPGSPVGGDSGSQPPAGSPTPDPQGIPIPVEYQVAHVRVPEADAPRLAQVYTFMRNHPERAADLDALLSGQSPQPAWRSPEPVAPPPQYIPPTVGGMPYVPSYAPSPAGYLPPPPMGTPALDMEDPNIRYLAERQRQLEAEVARARQSADEQRRQWETQQAQERDRVSKQTREQMLQAAVQQGAQRFATSHPELDQGQLQQIAVFVAQTNLARGLAERMPWDQAVAEAMELAAPRVLQTPGAVTQTPADVQRQRTLTALSGSTGSAGGRTEQPPPPAQNPLQRRELGSNDFRTEAIRMLNAAGRQS